jgi:hypothetical protein
LRILKSLHQDLDRSRGSESRTPDLESLGEDQVSDSRSFWGSLLDPQKEVFLDPLLGSQKSRIPGSWGIPK